MIYNKTLVSEPGKIMNIILRIAKRFCFCDGGRKFLNACLYSAGFLFGFLLHGFPKKIVPCQQPPFLIFILQLTRGGDDIIFRGRDSHVKGSKFAVIFALLKIGHGMPSIFVINSGLGIPLSHLVALSFMTSTREVVR